MRALAIVAVAAGTAAVAVGAGTYKVARLDDGHVGSSTVELRAQIDHSRDVVGFFTAGDHAWMRAPERATCWSFEGRRRRVCDRARRTLAAHRWLLSVAEVRLDALQPRTVQDEICAVFGKRCGEALRVAWCESRMNVWATNGQYVNLFQMGEHERRLYGWHVAGSPARVAAEAAHSYFLDYGWGPWECKP